MSWSSSNRLERLPSNWPQIKTEVFRLKGRRCHLRWRGCTDVASDIDHVIAGDDHSLENLQPVCSSCHRIKSSREGTEAKARKRALRYRPRDRHPGRR